MLRDVNTSAHFDADKWKNIINSNIEMFQKKVEVQTPYDILHRELDDLKVIVSNCFDQLSKSISRQLQNMKKEVEMLSQQL